MTDYSGLAYFLPEGWTFNDLAEQRIEWDINPRFAPVVSIPGVCTGWGAVSEYTHVD